MSLGRALALTAGLGAGCAAPGDGDDDGEPETAVAEGKTTGVCGSEPRQAPVGSSIRILSYNTQLLSPWFSMPSPDAGLPANAMTNEKAGRIARVLRRGEFDVIGLSEVWDEDDGKDLLVDNLCPTYPHFVRSVDAGQFTEERPEDSGLMVFSKLAFLPLPSQAFVSDDSESSLGDDSDRVAYARFASCSGVDCLASKGAAMVRLSHPSSGRVLNFVTTHLQADDDQAATRTAQMRQIRGQCETGAASQPNLITSTLGLSLAANGGLCAWTNTEWVALTGDLNIRGEGAIGASVHPGTATPAPGSPEYTTQIGAPTVASSVTRYALHDAWAETTSPLDLGLSHEASGQRLDYIMPTRRTVLPPVTGPTTPDMCVQHVWSPPELDGISDHQPVAADLNLMAPQCNPRLAFTVPPSAMTSPTTPKAGQKLKRNLSFPGSMQWFRVDEPGTYTLAISDTAAGNVSFEVFTADNLSVPLGGAHNLGTDIVKGCSQLVTGAMACPEVAGTKFVLPQAPFFIRTFSTNRAFSGAYSLTVYRYKCNSPAEPCAVLPHAPHPFKFPPAGTPLNADDAAWFQVDIAEQADSGAAQSLRFHADHTGAGSWTTPTLQLFESTGTTQLAALDGTAVSGQLAMTNPAGKQRAFRTAAVTANRRVLMKVRRNNVNQALELDAGWQTNLVLVGALQPAGAKLVCEDETNPEVGSDEIRMRIQVDGAWRDGGFADFDCNDGDHSRPWSTKVGVIRALSEVRVRVLEEDDFLAGGDDPSGAAVVDFPAMESKFTQPQQHSINWVFSDGDYRFDFQVGKWRD